MKLTVHYKHQIHVVPCGNGNNSVKWLKEETVRRATKNQAEDNNEEEVVKVDSLEVNVREYIILCKIFLKFLLKSFSHI